MAIDADLNAGIITQAEAITRRQEVREEADFYGAMDGAARFNQRDSMATILITAEGASRRHYLATILELKGHKVLEAASACVRTP